MDATEHERDDQGRHRATVPVDSGEPAGGRHRGLDHEDLPIDTQPRARRRWFSRA